MKLRLTKNLNGAKKVVCEELSKEEVENIISAAFYGSYWCGVKTSTTEYRNATGKYIEEKIADVLVNGKCIELYDIEDEEEETIILTLEKLIKGLNKYFAYGGSIEIEDYDLEEADSVLQYAVFDEIVFA